MSRAFVAFENKLNIILYNAYTACVLCGHIVVVFVSMFFFFSSLALPLSLPLHSNIPYCIPHASMRHAACVLQLSAVLHRTISNELI